MTKLLWAALLTAAVAPPAQAAIDAASPARAATPAYIAETARNRWIIYDFVDILYRQRQLRRAFEIYVAPGYVQHHPGMADGRDVAVAALEPLFKKPATRIEVRQILVDGNRATVEIVGHMSPRDPGSVVINIFRLENGKIVEHWDVTEAIKGNTPSGRPPY